VEDVEKSEMGIEVEEFTIKNMAVESSQITTAEYNIYDGNTTSLTVRDTVYTVMMPYEQFINKWKKAESQDLLLVRNN
jgi:hypothetical protein